MRLTDRLLTRLTGANARGTRAASTLIAALPAYQVALWPDGWQLDTDGRVHVQDTHCMAEARRWLDMARRNAGGRMRSARAEAEAARAMRLHGVFVPRAVIDMAGRCLPSEQTASVALTIAAGEWLAERRRTLAGAPEQALAERARAWSGSRHAGTPDADAARRLLRQLIAACLREGLLPPARYRLACSLDDGYGVGCCRCTVQVDLDAGARARVADVLQAALIPWNRAVARHGGIAPVIAVTVRAGSSGARRMRTCPPAGIPATGESRPAAWPAAS